MPDVSVTIAGRVYRVACDEGEEAKLSDLARLVDGKIESMRERFGELGDQRLTIMAALSFADEFSDARDRICALEAEIASLVESLAKARRSEEDATERLATCLSAAAERIERVAFMLAGPQEDDRSHL